MTTMIVLNTILNICYKVGVLNFAYLHVDYCSNPATYIIDSYCYSLRSANTKQNYHTIVPNKSTKTYSGGNWKFKVQTLHIGEAL